MRRGIGIVGSCLVIAALVSACQGAASPEIQSGRADVNAAGDGGSITTSSRTYGLPIEGIAWVDRQGNHHDSGRPECLAPGASSQVRFAAVEVQVQNASLHQVVWISCQ